MASLLKEPFDGYAYGDIDQIFTTVADVAGGSADSLTTTSSPRPGKQYLKLGCTGSQSSSKKYQIVPQYPNASGNVFIFGMRFTAVGFYGRASVGASGPFGGGTQTMSTLFTILLTGSVQCYGIANSDGTVSIYRGDGTLLGTSAAAISLGTTLYLEFKITVHPSAGTIDVRFNGVADANLTGLTGKNTAATGTAGWNGMALPIYGSGGNISAGYYGVMDVYLADGSGSVWNDFMGDMRMDWVPVNAAGTNNASTPSTGSDRSATVDENPMNGDTDYNTFATIGDLDTYNMPDAPVAGAAILGLETRAQVRKTDAGTATIKHAMLINGTVYLGDELAVPSTYTVARQSWDVNPDTSAAWTDTGASGFNASELGLKKTA